ncbi:HTH_48 domain-containing protein [Trichonephila clavipes]|nr:HTH_48 domain-containing protein [Trichonephila clavipes]
MFETIDQPADCEIRSVIRFLTAKNVSAAEIHRQISDVYGPNAMSSRKVRKWNLIRSFGWEQIYHPPYSPVLAPSDFHLFRHLKEFLGGKRFDTADEVKEEVQDWLSLQAADVYDLGIQKLVERYDKCLNKYGKYAEK